MKKTEQKNHNQRDTHQSTDLKVQGSSIDTVIVASGGSQVTHGGKSSFWTIIKVLATVVGAIVAVLTYCRKTESGKNQNDHFNPTVIPQSNAPAKSDVPAKSVADTTNLPAVKSETATNPNPAVFKSGISETELALLSQTNDAVTWSRLLPFVAPVRTTSLTGDVIEKPQSYSKLDSLLPPNLAGLNNVYRFLRENINADGQPWIEHATGAGVYQGDGNGNVLAIEWWSDDTTKVLLTNRQQLLRKFAPVLLKAGVLKP